MYTVEKCALKWLKMTLTGPNVTFLPFLGECQQVGLQDVVLTYVGALDNTLKFSFLAKLHLSCENQLLLYKYKKKNPKIPSESVEIINFVKHA